jgi:hypothetical protein
MSGTQSEALAHRWRATKTALQSKGLNPATLKVAINSEFPIDTITRYFNNKHHPPKGFLQACEQYLREKIVDTSLGSYRRELVATMEGRYQLVRPAYGDTKTNIICTDFSIIWNSDVPALVYVQQPFTDDFKWSVGGKIAQYSNTQIYHFIEDDNRRGRHSHMSLSFVARTGNFKGLETALAGNLNAPIAVPVCLVPWETSKQFAGIVDEQNGDYAYYRKLLLGVANFCNRSWTLRCE